MMILSSVYQFIQVLSALVLETRTVCFDTFQVLEGIKVCLSLFADFRPHLCPRWRRGSHPCRSLLNSPYVYAELFVAKGWVLDSKAFPDRLDRVTYL
jgi:hypothetical protein